MSKQTVQAPHTYINTLALLKASGYVPRSIKQELRDNLIIRLQKGLPTFEGIVGYEDTVIPEVERAILSGHNMLFLGLRGQAKTRMARLMVNLLDEYIPAIAGTDLNEDPLNPCTQQALDILAAHGDDTPVKWVHRSQRYGEKLATPDVSVADLIGDIDPIKAANLKLTFADERVIHYGIIPRSNRGIFVINELPDLQARIQVALFNILEEGDVQIRGFKMRLPLDILFVFTANPEDYTNRGSIVTPLKDRIQSQILTHYPHHIEDAMSITAQEASLSQLQQQAITVQYLIKELIEQVAFEARNNEYVDRKSGVSARLTISAYENAVSTAERRILLSGETQTLVWMSDLAGMIPAITGKIELVYEGEQEGSHQVANQLIERAIRTLFLKYFPNPEKHKKRKSKEQTADISPYDAIIKWFDDGNELTLLHRTKDAQKVALLKNVAGLSDLVQKHYPQAKGVEKALLMEFVLHGLSAYSVISKNVISNNIVFKDIMGGMMNFSQMESDN
jgi:magnesium chelatase subunit I